MDYLESLRGLKGSALDGISRALYERDVRAFEEIIVRLAVGGNTRDYETAAAMLATALVSVGSAKNNYASARFGAADGEEYLNLFISACSRLGVGESGYMPMLLYAQYARKGGALNSWDKSIDRYLEKLAREDFDRAANLIDKYDGKFGKYSILIKIDRARATDRLLGMAIYGKNINKAAVRDVLMDYAEVVDRLIAAYPQAHARERVAIVRLLCAFKNDAGANEFLREKAACDKSKSVREAALTGIKTARIKNAAAYLENVMAEGEGHTVSDWKIILSDPQLGATADRIFFFMPNGSGRSRVLVYNDGEFLGGDDRPIADGGGLIYILHPLDVTSDCADILAVDIEQPFLQIKRPVFHLLPDERFSSGRLAGTMIARDEFFANAKRCGFVLCAKRSDDERTTFVRKLGEYVIAAECDMPTSSATVSCGKLYCYSASDVVKLKRNIYVSAANPLDMRTLPRIRFSELIYLAYKLFGEI